MSLRTIAIATLVAACGPFSAHGAAHAASTLAPKRETIWHAPPVDTAALALNEEARRSSGARPALVGLPLHVDVGPANAGSWERAPGGEGRWRLELSSPGALWTILGFDRYRLPAGAELRVRGVVTGRDLGPFTAADAGPDGSLWLPPIPGDTVLLELDWPRDTGGESEALHLSTLTHGFLPYGPSAEESTAADCHIDVNCPLGDDWQYQKRGVVQVMVGSTGAYCTGSLVNNTKLDCKPYVLTAEHCYSPPDPQELESTTFVFNYELPSCEPGTVYPELTKTGSFKRATHAATDYRLLEMWSAPPAAWSVFFNGWSRSSPPPFPAQAWIIHHPLDGVKKISHDDGPIASGSDPQGGPDHWRVNNWEEGTTDPGSSGSPLFDPGGRIIGELHLATSNCNNPSGYAEFGRFDLAWANLGAWLDPAPATGVTVLDGLDQSLCGAPGPRLSLSASIVDDSAGFSNGHADPGESFFLKLELFNDGPVMATSVTGVLSTTQPGVTIVDGTASWAAIAPFQKVLSTAPHFALTVAPNYPCGASIPLKLALVAAQGVWQVDFLLETGTALGPQAPPPFADSMESGTNGWTTQNLVNNNLWTLVTTASHSPTHSWHVNDPTGVKDSVLIMPSVASVPPRATLSFWHLMNSEAGDGGVLEYRVNAGAWQDALPLITDGSYNSVISTAFASPIGGRKAWAGNLGGWREVQADLTALEGKTLDVRWRFATDTLGGGAGWNIDDVRLDAPTIICVSCDDLDDDGFCPAPTGDDCDDTDPAVHPGAPEVCDGVANDCDNPAWPALPSAEIDADGDGPSACAGDCNGADATVEPGAPELCDGLDNDCDGSLDEGAGCDASCDLTELAGPIQPIDDHPSTSLQPALAWNGNGHGLVWCDARDGNLELYFSRLDAWGEILVGPKRLTFADNDALEPALVWNGAEYAVSWCDKRGATPQIYFRRLDASGNPLGAEIVVGDCPSDGNSTLAWNGAGYGIAWVDPLLEIRFRRLDAVGLPQGSIVQLSDGSGTSRSPALAWNGSEYGVVWQGRDAASEIEIFFTRVSALGSELGFEAPVTNTAAQSRRPSIAWNGTGYGVAYNEGTGPARTVFFLRLQADGTVIGLPLQVTSAVTGGTDRPALAWTGGEYGLVWRDVRDGNGEVYFVRIAAGGTKLISDLRLTFDPAEAEPRALVWNGLEYGIAWSQSPAIRFVRLGCNCTDADHDGKTSCNDNCPTIVNPSQGDFDSDHEGDLCDLDDGLIYILFVSDTELAWQAELGYDHFNLYKGDLDVLKSTHVYTQLPGSNPLAARQCGLSSPAAFDPTSPAKGKTAFFLATGVAGGQEGGLGTDSSGVPRPNTHPCP